MKSKATGSAKAALVMLGLLAALVMAGESFAAKQVPAAPVDVNQASVGELSQIPGIGASKAQAIVDFRQVSPFKSTEELINVKGIGEKLYAKIAPFVTVSGKGAVQKNGTAEKATN